MAVSPMSGISNFAKPVSTPPSNMPNKSGVIPANDNLKPGNVQVAVDSVMPDHKETPSGSKTVINYVA